MPVIRCGNGGWKVEGTPGCPHKSREAALRQLKAIKVNQSKGKRSLLEQVWDNLKARKHTKKERDKGKRSNKEDNKK